jgi:hypothetical protein
LILTSLLLSRLYLCRWVKFVVILPLGSGYPSFSKPFGKSVNLPNLKRAYDAGSNSSIALPSGSSTWICLPPRTNFDFISKMQSRSLHRRNERSQIVHSENNPIPSARLLSASIGHWTGARTPGATEQNSKSPIREAGERYSTATGLNVSHPQWQPYSRRCKQGRDGRPGWRPCFVQHLRPKGWAMIETPWFLD